MMKILCLTIISIAALVMACLAFSRTFKNHQERFSGSLPQIKVITYADDRFGRKEGKYVKTQEKVTKIFKNHPEITDVKAYTFEDLEKTDFYNKNKKKINAGAMTTHFGNKQKFYFIQKELEKVPENTYILYHDCSPEIWSSPNFRDTKSLLPYIKECDDNNGIIIGEGGHGWAIHQHYTSPTCLEKLKMTKFKKYFQPCTSWILIKNTPFTRKLINEIMSWFDVEGCHDYITFKKLDKTKDSTFIEHRGDQSLLGLSLIKYGLGYIKANSKNIFSWDGKPASKIVS